MAAARLQQWDLFLGEHTYTTEFKWTKLQGNADGLPRLPQLQTTEETADPETVFHNAPVTSAQVKREINRDTIISELYDFTVNGRPTSSTDQFSVYATRKEQLSVCQGCLMWGSHVILPPTLRAQILDSLHDGHLGVVKMKSLGRSYVWWPGIDNTTFKTNLNPALVVSRHYTNLRQHMYTRGSGHLLLGNASIRLCWTIYGPNVSVCH